MLATKIEKINFVNCKSFPAQKNAGESFSKFNFNQINHLSRRKIKLVKVFEILFMKK